VRKAVRVRGHFPSDEAATKLIWLVLHNMYKLELSLTDS
jgi:transposase-like protein